MYNLRKEVKVEKTSYNVLVTINPKSSENLIEDKRFFNSMLMSVEFMIKINH